MKEDVGRLFAAIALSFLAVSAWNYFFPRQSQQVETEKVQESISLAPSTLKEAGRVIIETPSLKGSISNCGLRFDDLKLVQYKQSIESKSAPVVLLDKSDYFLCFDFGSEVDAPGPDAVWKPDSLKLTPSSPVNFHWRNTSGVKFNVKVEVDEKYLFTISSAVANASRAELKLQGKVTAYRSREVEKNTVLMRVLDGQLDECSFSKVSSIKNAESSSTQWIGINDRYWLAAIIPQSLKASSKIESGEWTIASVLVGGNLSSGESYKETFRLFLGAKELNLLDQYKANLKVSHLDRAVHFSLFPFIQLIARPLFQVLSFFYNLSGNYGVAIILLTLCLRAVLLAVGYRSDLMMGKMGTLQPKIQRIKELYRDDPERIRTETLELYKKEKISLVGCLPMLLQIPIMYAVYEVLEVAIELRQAKFLLWIKDLSAKDPTNLFNLFGLLPWQTPSFLHVGILPILFSFSMYVQQKVSAKPVEPSQAFMLSALPVILLFVASGMPAGLVLYWIASNIFSLLQQVIIKARLKKAAA
jgi:YidC/Oxa1 family membrane protein insertase